MIYLCIPALNEAPTVGVLVWKLRQVMAEFGREYQVLVLDDASTDDTQDVLSPYTRVMPLTVLRNGHTMGYASSVERLLREAVGRSTHPKRDSVVVLQADFSDSPDDVPGLVRRLEGGADVVGRAVQSDPEQAPRVQRWIRRGVSWLLAGRAVPREIRDPASGFRAYRMAVLKRMLAERPAGPVLSGGVWAANVQLLLAVAPYARRADVAELGGATVQPVRPSRLHTWGTAVDLWRVARAAPRRSSAPPAPEPPAEPAAVAPQGSGRRGGQRRRPPKKKFEGEAAS